VISRCKQLTLAVSDEQTLEIVGKMIETDDFLCFSRDVRFAKFRRLVTARFNAE
jgi:hypothetical protein